MQERILGDLGLLNVQCDPESDSSFWQFPGSMCFKKFFWKVNLYRNCKGNGIGNHCVCVRVVCMRGEGRLGEFHLCNTSVWKQTEICFPCCGATRQYNSPIIFTCETTFSPPHTLEWIDLSSLFCSRKERQIATFSHVVLLGVFKSHPELLTYLGGCLQRDLSEATSKFLQKNKRFLALWCTSLSKELCFRC